MAANSRLASGGCEEVGKRNLNAGLAGDARLRSFKNVLITPPSRQIAQVDAEQNPYWILMEAEVDAKVEAGGAKWKPVGDTRGNLKDTI